MSANISQKQIVAGKLKFESELAAAKAASEASNRQTTRVFDVPVVVNEEKCISGCHVCVESCPVDLPGHRCRETKGLYEIRATQTIGHLKTVEPFWVMQTPDGQLTHA